MLCGIDPPKDLSFGWSQIEAVIELCFCFQVDQQATTHVFKYEGIRSVTPNREENEICDLYSDGPLTWSTFCMEYLSRTSKILVLVPILIQISDARANYVNSYLAPSDTCLRALPPTPQTSSKNMMLTDPRCRARVSVR